METPEQVPDPADEVVLADTVGVALHVVLDRLSAGERAAFVLYESFAIDYATIATILDTTPTAARKLASRARAKVAQPAPTEALADRTLVDAFLTAARGGDFTLLLELLAPDVVVPGDAAAVALGAPERIAGRHQVAEFSNGAAKAALSVFIGDRPGAAWIHRGEPQVAFDFTFTEGVVSQVDFRADPDVLAQVRVRAPSPIFQPLATEPVPR